MGNKEYGKNSIDYWSRFKVKTKEGFLSRAKNAYINFCRMLDETDFKLVSDYEGAMSKVELSYRFNQNIRLKICSNDFKTYTYKAIINFKGRLIKNGDEFIKFIGLTNGNSLIARIKTFDGGEVEIDINAYSKFNNSRQSFYNKLKEVDGHTEDFYKDIDTKINIDIGTIKLNPMSPHVFKQKTYKALFSFKNNLKENNDEFVKFVGITKDGNLIAKIKTFDGGEVDIDIGTYSKFNKSRYFTYYYCISKEYKILSPYLGNTYKILIDFNCGHKAHWITADALKRGNSCPVCNESKGEKAIEFYLKNKNINFKREYKFNDCKYKLPLPFDFYIEKYNLCIEFDGEQHYKSKDFFGGEEKLRLTKKER